MDNNPEKTEVTENLEKNLQIMEVVEKELEQQKKDVVFALIIFLTTVSAWILFVALWDTLGRPYPPEHMTYGVELIAILMLVVIKLFTNLKTSKLGLTVKNIGPAVKRALIITAVSFVVLSVIKIILKPGQPLLNWSKFQPVYMLTSILQEFLARGFLLTTLNDILDSKKGKHISIICSSLLFASLHLYYGFAFMASAGILSVVLSLCYMKDENIWGVSILHFAAGTMATMLELV